MKSKKLLLIVLSVVLIMCAGCKKETQLTNCGNNADVQEFENNSKIYIQGNIANVAGQLGSTKLTVDADGDEWIAYFKGLSCTKEIKKYLEGMEDIRCYGNFNKNKSVDGEKVMDIRYIHIGDASKETITADFLRGLETEKPTEIQTEEPTEKPTEKPTEAPTEPPTDPPTDPPTKNETSNIVLYNNNMFKISYHHVEEGWHSGIVELFFTVENKTDTTYEFQADTAVINGVSYNNLVMSDPVSAHSTGLISLNVYDVDENLLLTDIYNIGADLRYFVNSSDYDEYSNGLRGDIFIPQTNIK